MIAKPDSITAIFKYYINKVMYGVIRYFETRLSNCNSIKLAFARCRSLAAEPAAMLS